MSLDAILDQRAFEASSIIQSLGKKNVLPAVPSLASEEGSEGLQGRAEGLQGRARHRGPRGVVVGGSMNSKSTHLHSKRVCEANGDGGGAVVAGVGGWGGWGGWGGVRRGTVMGGGVEHSSEVGVVSMSADAMQPVVLERFHKWVTALVDERWQVR